MEEPLSRRLITFTFKTGFRPCNMRWPLRCRSPRFRCTAMACSLPFQLRVFEQNGHFGLQLLSCEPTPLSFKTVPVSKLEQYR